MRKTVVGIFLLLLHLFYLFVPYCSILLFFLKKYVFVKLTMQGFKYDKNIKSIIRFLLNMSSFFLITFQAWVISETEMTTMNIRDVVPPSYFLCCTYCFFGT